jgi:integrase
MMKKKSVRQRTRKGEIPRILRRKDRNLAFVLIEGKRYYVGTWSDEGLSPEAEVNRLRVWSEYCAKRGVVRESCVPVTVAVLVDRFLRYAEGHYVKHGRRTGTYDRFLDSVKPLFQLYADVPVAEFTPLALKAVRNVMLDSGKLCRETINSRIDCIRQIFRWGVENEVVQETTWHALTAVRRLQSGRTIAVDYPDVEPVSDDVIQKTLPYLPPVIADMVRIQRLTGMRPGEVCGMRPCDVYREGDVFPKRYVFLQRGLRGMWIYVLPEFKTEHYEGKERWVPLGFRCQAILEPYIAEREPEEYLFSPAREMAIRRARVRAKCRSVRVREPVRQFSDRYTSQVYYNAVVRAIERYNRREAEPIPHWFPYGSACAAV